MDTESTVGQRSANDPGASPVPRLRTIDTARLSRPIPPRVKPRGLPPALVGHEVFRTASPDDAARRLSPLLGPTSLAVPPSSRPTFHAGLHAVRFHDITLAYLDMAYDGTLSVEALADRYTVLMAMNGATTVESRADRADVNPITAAVLSPGASARVEWRAEAPQLMVAVEGAAMRAHLARLLARRLGEPLVFDVQLGLGSENAHRWSAAIQLLHTELLHEDSLLHRGRGTTALEEFVMSALLYAHESNYRPQLDHPQRSAGRRVVRAATDFIERNLSTTLSLEQIAQAAGCSVRTVQAGFRSELRMTTWAYVQDRRLERARADLLAALPDSTVTVSDVATRWGFTHLGRFARAYRDRFGELPSTTLHG